MHILTCISHIISDSCRLSLLDLHECAGRSTNPILSNELEKEHMMNAPAKPEGDRQGTISPQGENVAAVLRSKLYGQSLRTNSLRS